MTYFSRLSNLYFLIFENNNTILQYWLKQHRIVWLRVYVCKQQYHTHHLYTRISYMHSIDQFHISQRLLNSWKMSRDSRRGVSLWYAWGHFRILVGYRPKTSTEALVRRRVSMRQGNIIKLTMSRENRSSSQPLSHTMQISFNDDGNFDLRSHPREDFHSEAKQIMNAVRKKIEPDWCAQGVPEKTRKTCKLCASFH